MLNGQTLLGTLESQQTTRRGPTVLGVVGRIVGSLLLAAMIGAILALMGYRLWLGWQTGQWHDFWMLGITSIFFLYLPIVPIVVPFPWMNQQRPLLPALAPLREIAAAREDALTPPVIPQPPALPTEALPAGAIEIGPLKRLLTPNTQSDATLPPLIMLLILLPFMFLLTGTSDFQLGPILPFGFDPFGGASPVFDIVPFYMFGMFGFRLLIDGFNFGGFVLRALPRWGQMTVGADAEGLRWRAGRFGVTRTLAWRDVRSFSRITTGGAGTVRPYGRVNLSLGVVYLLDGPDASLIWTLTATASDSQYGAADLLCRLVVSRTGLPLRDLTAIANELAAARGAVRRLVRTRAQLGGANSVSPILARLALPLPAPHIRWRRVAPVLVVSCIPLLLSAAIFGYGGWVENYQQGYFASLPQRLHAETPLYQDTLNTENADWPVSAVTKQNHQGERFVNGAYQLFGDDPTQTNLAWETSSNIIGDAAFEVTETEQGKITSGANDGIGLVFNIDHYGNNFNLFQVNADGSWYLYTYHYDASNQPNIRNIAAEGTSSAIHQGLGATNTLLVIKRGQVCLLYANHQLIETYYDRDNVLAIVGYVGLFLNDDAQTGTFTNVAVYPVQPPSSQWWV